MQNRYFTSDELYHYGVIGMRWGKHKASIYESDNRLLDARKNYRHADSSNKKQAREEYKQLKKEYKSDIKEAKKTFDLEVLTNRPIGKKGINSFVDNLATEKGEGYAQKVMDKAYSSKKTTKFLNKRSTKQIGLGAAITAILLTGKMINKYQNRIGATKFYRTGGEKFL